MAKIPVYNNTLLPDASPMAEAARQAGRSAREIGVDMRRGYDDLAQGFTTLGNKLEQEDKQANMEDIANLSETSSGANADLANKWADKIANADPSDSTTAQQFMDNEWKQTWDTAAKEAKTEKGRLFIQKQQAHSFQHFAVITHSQQAAVVGQNAVESIKAAAVSDSDFVTAHPGLWKTTADNADSKIDDLQNAGGFKIPQADEQKRLARHNLAKVSLDTRIDTDPADALAAINNKEYDGVLTGGELEKAKMVTIPQRQKAIVQEQKAQNTAERQQARDNYNQEVEGAFLKAQPDPNTGRYAPKDLSILLDQMNAIGKKYQNIPGATSEAETRATRDWITGQISKGAKGDIVSDFDTKKELDAQMADGTLDKMTVLKAETNGLISGKQRAIYMRSFQNTPVQRKDEAAALKIVQGYHSYIMKSAMVSSNVDPLYPWAAQRMSELDESMMQVYHHMRDEEHLTGEELTKRFSQYVVGNLGANSPYKFTQDDVLNAMRDPSLITSGPSPLIPATPLSEEQVLGQGASSAPSPGETKSVAAPPSQQPVVAKKTLEDAKKQFPFVEGK